MDKSVLSTKKEKLRSVISKYFLLAKVFIQEIIRDDLDDIAKSMTYSFILSIFPGIIFLFTVIPYIPIAHLDQNIMDYLAAVLPSNLFLFIQETILDIVSRQNSQLLSFGFIFALFSANNGTLAMITAFNKCYQTDEKRSWIRTRIVSIALTFMLTFVLFISVVVLLVSEVALDYLVQFNILTDHITYYVIKLANLLVLVLTFYFSISFIYYFGPTKSVRSRFFSVGSALSTFLCIVATVLFGIYINQFSTYNKLYGSIGTVIIFMLWMYIIAWVILVGFEMNAILHSKAKKNLLV